jgi:2-keto-3-deoxy-L-rhamnonate aldolase RhmA
MAHDATLKQRIRDGEVVVSMRMPLESSREDIERGLAGGAYDFIYVDGQHTAFSDELLVSFCAAAEGLGLPVQFRIPHTRQTYLIGRFLDMGLSGILIPEVVAPATVDEAVGQAYYPQTGRRSWGGTSRLGFADRQEPPDRLEYAAWWNERVVLGIQVESVVGVSRAGALATPGVDYVAFGPNDLLFSLEGHPRFPLRTVDECMRNVAEQLADTGVRLGMAVVTDADDRGKYLDMGVTVFQETP